MASRRTAAASTISNQPGGAAAARRQAALEMIAREGPSLKQTARRYSICADDADDAYQRALEIALTKGPTDDPRELIRWTQVVTKHEALAIRRKRERMLGNPVRQQDGEEPLDWVAMLPAKGSGPDEAVELRERIARSREALRALKPAELRALTLLAEGYSYAEIGEITGFSRTKVNRCLAEGRERFRRLVSRSEDGSHCEDMAPLLSAFCDGEADPEAAAAVREHLRACAGCRATMRSYRATAGAAAALAPAFVGSGSLLERLQELGAWLHSRLPVGGGAAESAIGSAATAGGAGGAAIGKALAACAVSAGAAAACMATGVVPAPVDLSPKRVEAPTIERVSPAVVDDSAAPGAHESPAAPVARPSPKQRPQAPPPEPQPPAEEAPAPVQAGAVEYEEPGAPPPPAPAASTGSAAGEFGP